jgi:hypothetical protein
VTEPRSAEDAWMRRLRLSLAAAVAVVAAATLTAGPAAAAAPVTRGAPITRAAPVGRAASCPAVDVLAVRGTFEKGTVGGAMAPLTDRLRRELPGPVRVEGVPYPATSDWVPSVNAGITSLATRLAARATACPRTRFVLVGYSQGAWVIGDALGGGGGGVAGKVEPALGSRVAAVVLFGDPRFRSGEPFNEGSSRAGVNGLIPRPPGGLAGYATRVRSYCDGDDSVCQSGARGDGHFGYWPKDDADAADFVAAALRAPVATPAPSAAVAVTPSPSVSPTPSPTAAPPAPPRPERRSWFKRLLSWLNPFD